MATTLTKPLVLRLPKPMLHQLPVLLHPARNKVAVCGRRWGKTALGLQATIRGHGPKRSSRRGALDGGKIWWVAPDYPTASEIWRDLKRATRTIWVHKDEIERRVELPTGGSIAVKSAHDPESLVAVGLDGVVLDEAAKIKPDSWYQSLRPTLSDRGGWSIFIGTPKGYNWFHDLFQHADTTPDWARWQRPTSDNPLIPASELEAAKRDSPRYYGQEYEAQFTSLEGTEWPADYFPASMMFNDWPAASFVRTALALDPAQGKDERRKGCYASFVFAGLDAHATLWLDCWAARDWDASRLVSMMFELNGRLHPNAVSVEVNGGQAFLVPLIAAKAKELKVTLPLYTINNSVNKEVRIRDLGPYLAQGKIRIRDTPGGRLLIQQLRDFPVGEYVDCPDSAEMAVRMIRALLGQRGGVGQPEIVRG